MKVIVKVDDPRLNPFTPYPLVGARITTQNLDKILKIYLDEKIHDNVLDYFDSLKDENTNLESIKQMYNFCKIIVYTCEKIEERENTKDYTLEEMFLSTNTYNALKRFGLDTTQKIIDYFGIVKIQSESFLKNTGKRYIRNFGTKSRAEIQNKFKELGII